MPGKSQFCYDDHENGYATGFWVYLAAVNSAYDNIDYLYLFRPLCISNVDFTKESLLNPSAKYKDLVRIP